MNIKRQLVKLIKKTSKLFKRQLNELLKTLFINRTRRSTANSGFVLPTVAMVTLVVVLLTTAILFRSFQRAKSASNVRVNEAVLQAAIPAIDRAKAKLDQLFSDSRLPRSTPSDTALESTLNTYINQYTFGDESQLQLTYSYPDPTNSANKLTLPNLQTAWMLPVDTNNNGKFDTYTLYAIYFRNPPISNGQYTRPRLPLEARTLPMTAGSLSSGCQDTQGTSASLVGSTGWFNITGQLKKSVFVYTANVPIINPPNTTQYETYQGNQGFSGLEYQQDRTQLPLVNNAVVYNDDIELTPGAKFNLNGRILTNSNFLTGSGSSTITLYQVSSQYSCFYTDQNAKIIVGGNLGAGGFTNSSDSSNATVVHLNQGQSVAPNTNNNITSNKSVTDQPQNIAYNSLAYVQRINRLIQAQLANNVSTDPLQVQNGITQQKSLLGLSSYTATELTNIRTTQLQLYFQQLTRRVPYGEVGFGGDALGNYKVGGSLANQVLQGSGNTLRPPDAWVYPFAPTDGTTGTGYSTLTLNTSSGKALPQATEPITQQTLGKEQYVGDRALVGNNLPQLWWNSTTSQFVGPNTQDTQNLQNISWDSGPGTRTRNSRIQQLADLGTIIRDGYWESAAAQVPNNPQDGIGGLRVVTGAGIYLPSNLSVSSIATDFNSASTAIWSDMMPVPSATGTNGATADSISTFNGFNYTNVQVGSQPYLRMRATAVYHYQSTNYSQTNPKPIACVSSYYDPTNSTTAKNLSSLSYNTDPNGTSNNGITYNPPTKAVSNYQNLLNYQANLKYANGRWVNQILQNALAKNGTNLTLSEQSAIDATICAIQILDGSLTTNSSVVPNGAISELAFLDPRQIKGIHQDVSTAGVETFTNADGNGTVSASVPSVANYDLAKEQRQPLEIRATVLDINKLRTTTFGSATPQEYLLPNSGIIYASRDDALPDSSFPVSSGGVSIQQSQSPVDFILDPTRRPNAIMLINGNPIYRTLNYRDGEKGLILASNLPVYIRGDFNQHTQQEFTVPLNTDWSNFYSSTDRSASNRNPQFACRFGDTRLPNCKPNGDTWRPASVLADAITLLSNNWTLGYRTDGDYDLNNNLGNTSSITAFTNNGFSTNNANVVSANWYANPSSNTTGLPTAAQSSSYFNNFVTPIQRRKSAPEYLMEVCPKLPVSACDPANDWYVNVGTGLRASDIAAGTPFIITTHKSGTTVKPPDSSYARYPRRVAFQRTTSSPRTLVLNNNLPIVIGIKSANINQFPLTNFSSTSRPDSQNNALWFRTATANNDNTPPTTTPSTFTASTTNQPILSPVLQVQVFSGTDSTGYPLLNSGQSVYWLQQATDTTFNLVFAAGDTPARPIEDNGGLHNFLRFLENWNPNSNANNSIINGSFMQTQRSAYATAPYMHFLTNVSGNNNTYPTTNASGKTPFYMAPTRLWGYDVGLLSQSPDLFAQKLALTPSNKPDEYFREVARDDSWIKTLLCAKKVADGSAAIDTNQRPNCN